MGNRLSFRCHTLRSAISEPALPHWFGIFSQMTGCGLVLLAGQEQSLRIRADGSDGGGFRLIGDISAVNHQH